MDGRYGYEPVSTANVINIHSSTSLFNQGLAAILALFRQLTNR